MRFIVGDKVLYQNDIFIVSWIDDTGVTGLVGLRGIDDTTIVVSYLDKIITKVDKEES